MSESQAHATIGSSPVTARGFWMAFIAGWLAYLGLFVSVGTLTEGMSLGRALMVAAVNVGPPAVLSSVVAANRRRLLRTEWGLGRTVAVHVGVGAAFAVSTGIVVTLFVSAFGYEEQGLEAAGKSAAVMYRSFAGGFLYATPFFV